MIYPSTECANFCNWLLNTGNQKLSGPQRVIVQSVFTAALNGTGIDDQEWYNFNLFTSWRYPVFTSWWELQSQPQSAFVAGVLSDYIAACAAADAAAPSVALQNRIVQAFSYADAQGWLGVIDAVYLFSCDSVSQVTIPVYNPHSVTPSVVGSIGFAASSGIYSLASSYLNSGLNLSAAGLNFTRNSATISGRFKSPVVSDAYVCGVINAGTNFYTRIIGRSSSNNMLVSLNGLDAPLVRNLGTVGTASGYRSSSSEHFTSMGSGMATQVNNTSVAIPSLNLYILAANASGSATGFFTNQVGCVVVGGAVPRDGSLEIFEQILCGW